MSIKKKTKIIIYYSDEILKILEQCILKADSNSFYYKLD